MRLFLKSIEYRNIHNSYCIINLVDTNNYVEYFLPLFTLHLNEHPTHISSTIKWSSNLKFFEAENDKQSEDEENWSVI